MGAHNSAWYLAKMTEIEDMIAEEHNLAGVSEHENGDDRLQLENRIASLISLKNYYELEYEKALALEGEDVLNFIPRRMMGN